ncbi:MAG: hypothetical protein JWQ90_3722 [Hydrocarboniphaga sp.]|uniref:hypothetical protein n=1 Tax=Hydrocarboniphaga sp. TaxID=2033016 RepID=UPI00262E9B2C|nr:hypothetical protein [Hydrocarboniphaga sp.]MDB5971272.1 hypothetical protein [Hydrocarboniphaga sp.]
MLWQIYFWLLAAMLVLPVPVKLLAYFSGKDKSSMLVKAEETTNACFFCVGLIGLHGYIHSVHVGPAGVWYLWLGIALAWSVLALFWSPKLAHAGHVLGLRKARILAGASTVLLLPLLFAVYSYASQA